MKWVPQGELQVAMDPKHMTLIVLCLSTIFLSVSLRPASGQGAGGGASGKPETLRIGALLATNSTIGKAALAAMDYAIQMVNNDSSVLPDTKLEITIANTNCSAFQGAAAGMLASRLLSTVFLTTLEEPVVLVLRC